MNWILNDIKLRKLLLIFIRVIRYHLNVIGIYVGECPYFKRSLLKDFAPKGIWSFDLVSQLIASIDVLKCHRVHSIYQAYRHMSIFQTYKIFSNVKMDLI